MEDLLLSSLVVQLLLMNNGIHFSTFPVSNTAEIQQICESQLSGEVILFSFVGPNITSLSSMSAAFPWPLSCCTSCAHMTVVHLQAQTVILINCGGEVDLYEDLNLAELETRVIVADSHR